MLQKLFFWCQDNLSHNTNNTWSGKLPLFVPPITCLGPKWSYIFMIQKLIWWKMFWVFVLFVVWLVGIFVPNPTPPPTPALSMVCKEASLPVSHPPISAYYLDRINFGCNETSFAFMFIVILDFVSNNYTIHVYLLRATDMVLALLHVLI